MARRPAEGAEWIRGALEEFERPLVRYAWRLTGNPEVARDVVQDTFLKLCQQSPGSLNGKLGPWLYTVCRNRASDVRKKEGRTMLIDTAASEARVDGAPLPDARASSAESSQMVLAYLRELPEKQQEVFLLKFENGLTFREISEVTGMPLATVSFTITKAIKTLRTRLQPILRPEDAREGEES